MKKIIVVILIALSAMTLSSYLIGSKAETHIQSLFSKINKNPYFSVEIIDYNRGLFRSEMKFSLNFTLPTNTGLSQSSGLIIDQTLFHGPLLWRTKTIGFGMMDSTASITLPDEIMKQLENNDSINEETFQLTTRTQFDGSTITYLSTSNIVVNEENILINIKPSVLDFSYSESGHMVSHFNWQGMEITSMNKTSFAIGKTEFNLNQQIIRGDLFSTSAIATGSFDTLFESISINPSSTPIAIELSNFYVKAVSDVNDNLMGVNTVFKIAKIEAMNMKFTDFVFDYSMLNFDIDVLQRFSDTMAGIQSNNPANPELIFSEFSNALQPLIPDFLESEPKLTINQLGLTSSEGTLSTRLDLFINNRLYDKDDLNSLIPALEVHASGEAPQTFFDQFGLKPIVNSYLEQKMLIRSGSLLKFKADYINQKLLINDRVIPLTAQ